MAFKKRNAEFPSTREVEFNKNVGTYYKNLTTLELFKSLQIAKCNLICRNYYILLEISKKLLRKIL
ncbi:hypothetical protein BW243_06705 [Leptospira interrogans serovar Pomona]|nr:hypothetical protein BW243_06705 [Leptospira interrogans serovar Pomona]